MKLFQRNTVFLAGNLLLLVVAKKFKLSLTDKIFANPTGRQKYNIVHTINKSMRHVIVLANLSGLFWDPPNTLLVWQETDVFTQTLSIGIRTFPWCSDKCQSVSENNFLSNISPTVAVKLINFVWLGNW